MRAFKVFGNASFLPCMCVIYRIFWISQTIIYIYNSFFEYMLAGMCAELKFIGIDPKLDKF